MRQELISRKIYHLHLVLEETFFQDFLIKEVSRALLRNNN